MIDIWQIVVLSPKAPALNPLPDLAKPPEVPAPLRLASD